MWDSCLLCPKADNGACSARSLVLLCPEGDKDAILHKQNSKRPTQNLGFRKTLRLARLRLCGRCVCAPPAFLCPLVCGCLPHPPLSPQVAPLQEGLANVTVLAMTHVLVLPTAAFYTAAQFGPHYGTLAYRRAVWRAGALQFHDVSFAEDAMFLLHALGQCHAVLTLPSPVAVYARHGANALAWHEGVYAAEGPMARSSRPPWFPESVLQRYVAAAEVCPWLAGSRVAVGGLAWSRVAVRGGLQPVRWRLVAVGRQ